MKLELIIPKLDNDGSDNAAVIEDAVRTMCSTFGGATVYEAAGFWVNADGRLYHDPVSVIVSAATAEGEARDAMVALARRVLDLTDQEAVFVSINGKAEIIQ